MKRSRISALGKDAAIVGVLSLLLLGLIELMTGYFYYIKGTVHRFAIYDAVHDIGNRLLQSKAARSVLEFEQKWGLRLDETWIPFFSNQSGMLAIAQAAYEKHFVEFMALAGDIDARVVVLYIPSYDSGPAPAVTRPFFRMVAGRHGADFIDLTDSFSRYPETATNLVPWDSHLSRFGNRLIAEALANDLSTHVARRSRHTFSERPQTFADLPPNSDTLWEMVSEAPYKVTTNRYGFRMSYDFALDDPRQKILVIGDSHTFGMFLSNRALYTAILDDLLPDVIVMNSGVVGYTITDELSLFRERAQFIGPDIVVLQVADNDLIGLLFYYRNRYDRKKNFYAPTKEEIQFLMGIRRSDSEEPDR